MTPIKSLAMIKRSLQKAFVCKSHVMITIHSEWCLLFFHIFAMGRARAIYFLGGGGGLAKEKQSHAQEKKEKRMGTQGSMGKRLCKSHLFLGFV